MARSLWIVIVCYFTRYCRVVPWIWIDNFCIEVKRYLSMTKIDRENSVIVLSAVKGNWPDIARKMRIYLNGKSAIFSDTFPIFYSILCEQRFIRIRRFFHSNKRDNAIFSFRVWRQQCHKFMYLIANVKLHILIYWTHTSKYMLKNIESWEWFYELKTIE